MCVCTFADSDNAISTPLTVDEIESEATSPVSVVDVRVDDSEIGRLPEPQVQCYI